MFSFEEIISTGSDNKENCIGLWLCEAQLLVNKLKLNVLVSVALGFHFFCYGNEVPTLPACAEQ